MSIQSAIKDRFDIRPFQPERRWVRFFVRHYDYIVGLLISLVVWLSLAPVDIWFTIFSLVVYWTYIFVKTSNFTRGRLGEIYSQPSIQLARVLGLIFCTTILLYYAYYQTSYLVSTHGDVLWLLYFPAISAINQQRSRNVFFIGLTVALFCIYLVHPVGGTAEFTLIHPLTIPVIIEGLWLILLSFVFYFLLHFMGHLVVDLNLIINIQNRMREMEGAFLRSKVRLEEKDYLQSVVKIIKDDLSLDHVDIFRKDKYNRNLVCVAGACEKGIKHVEEGYSIDLGSSKSIISHVALSQQSYCSNNVARDPVFLYDKDVPDTRAELAVPIIVRHRLYGVLDIQVHQAEYFLEQDVTALEILANHIGWVIDNSEQFNHINWINRMVETIAAPLFTQTQLDETIQEIADSALHELETDLVFLYSYDPSTETGLSSPIYAGNLYHPELMDPASIDPDNVVFRLVSSGDPMYINEDLSSVDLYSHPLFRPSPTHLKTGRPTFIEREDVHSNVIIRLLLNEKCLGLLFLNFRRSRTFSDWDKKRYLSFAHLAALAIQKIQLQQHVVQREKNELSNFVHDRLIGDTLGLFKILNSANQALSVENEPSEKAKNNIVLAIKATEDLHNDIRWINRLLKESNYEDLMLELDKLFMMFKQVFNVTSEAHWAGDMSQIHPALARELFLVIKEAMTNAVRHGKAKTITFTGSLKSNELSTVIVDDGIGFDQRTVKHKNGILSMKYRIEELGGVFDISSNPGRGTRISLKVPILHTSEVQDGKTKQ